MARDNYFLRSSPPAFIPDGPEGDRTRAMWPSMGTGPIQVGFIPEGWTAEQVLSGEYARAQEEKAAREEELAELSRMETELHRQEIEGDESAGDKMAAMRARKAELKAERSAENQRLNAERNLALRGRVGL